MVGCMGLVRKLRRRYLLLCILLATGSFFVLEKESPTVEAEVGRLEKAGVAKLKILESEVEAEFTPSTRPVQVPASATPSLFITSATAAPPASLVAEQSAWPGTSVAPPPTLQSNPTPMASPPNWPPTPPAPTPVMVLPSARLALVQEISGVTSASTNASPATAQPVFSGNNDAVVRDQLAKKSWRSLGETRDDAVDIKYVLAHLSYANPWNPPPRGKTGVGSWTQGWDITYSPEMFKSGPPLQVFVMPHSHNDPGWLWPFEEYYHKYTGGIITTAIKALKKNPSRKFIWAEVSFFELWWQHASSTMQQDARDVVKSGQFEFVTAGWVMNDEANCHIFAILEQLYEGREFVERTFGVKPTTGYAVDPFGQSAVMAQVLKRMGYDAMYINRVQYAVKRVLAEKHNMDFIWRQHWDKTGTTDMITHMHPFFNYDVPHSCGPQPGVCCQFDFLRLETSGMTCPWGVKPEPISRANVHAKAQLYLDQIFKKATLFGGRAGHSNAVLVPIGGDLEYQHDSIAEKMFTNYEALFEHINNDPSFNVNIQFGTLADYFAAVKKQHSAESNLRVVGGPSFFTYADKDEEYWSGYYTSRPFYKSINRELESLVHAAEFLSASFLRTGQAYQSEIQSGLQKARRAMALFQHHDAITGTSKHATMNDYGSRLYDGVKSMQCLINTAIERLASKQLGVHLAGLQPAHVRATATGLPQRMLLQFPDGGAARVVTVFNPTGRTRVSLLIQPVDSAEVCIRDADGTLKPTQINPMYSLDLGVRQSGGYEAVYPVEVPAFAVKVVELVRDSKCKSPMATVWPAEGGFGEAEESDSIALKTSQITASFGKEDGNLKHVETTDRKRLAVTEKFMAYHTQKSGAYIFVPNGPPKTFAGNEKVRVIRGQYMQVVHTMMPNLARVAVVSEYMGPTIWMTHYVDVTKQSNEEWIVRYDTDLKTSRTLYTEMNGWTTDQHVIRDDPQVPLQTKYFPLPGAAYLEDTHDFRRFNVHAGHPCGVGSMAEGSIEVMLDRRLTKDDARGMNEAMSDNLPVQTTLALLFESAQTGGDLKAAEMFAPSLASLLASEWVNRPLVVSIFPGEAQLSAARLIRTVQADSDALADWPCDLSLDALKLSPTSETGSLVRARLARRAFDSRYGLPPYCATTPQNAVSTAVMDASKLFTATDASKGVKVLSLGGDGADTLQQRFYLPAMEWALVEFTWPDRPTDDTPLTSCAQVQVPSAAMQKAASADQQPSPSHACDFEDGVDWLPASDEHRPASSADACCGICKSIMDCRVGVFDAHGEVCWIKRDISGGKRASTTLSCEIKR